MITILTIFLIISSGSILGISYYHKKYEELLPITIFGITFLMYLFSLIKLMKIGVWCILALAVIMYLFSVYYIIKQGHYREIIKNLFTPAFAMFCIIYIIIMITSVGRMVHSWDEYTFWGISVKDMFYRDSLFSDIGSATIIYHYVPGMGLFQYFCEKIKVICTGNNTFSDWWLYAAYQIFMFSLFIPFLKKLKWKNIIYNILLLCSIYLFPSILFRSNGYSLILIDCFLGVLLGFCAFSIYLYDESDKINHINIIAALIMLVLTKDVGLIFAVCLSVILFVRKMISLKEFKWKNILISLMPLVVVFITKISWSLNILKRSKIETNYSSVSRLNGASLVQLLRIITGIEKGYQRTSFINYVRAMFDTTRVRVPFLGDSIGTSYFILFVCLVFFMVYITKKDITKKIGNKENMVVHIGMFLVLVFYIGCQCGFYLFIFSEAEAINLSSLDRYLYIGFLGLLFYLFYIGLEVFNNIDIKNAVIFLTIIVMLTNVRDVVDILDRAILNHENETAYESQKIADDLMYTLNNNKGNIYYINTNESRHEAARYLFRMRYYMMPYQFPCNVGAGEDVYRNAYDGWLDDIGDKCDYVLLYEINDEFKEKYGDDFENNIDNLQIYKIDHNKLIKK